MSAPRPDSLTERIITVVEAVVDAGAPVGPRGLSRASGIDRSAVGRILQQLAELDVLERTAGGYLPGPRLFALGRVLAAMDSLADLARPLLESLVEQFDETCYVCALHGEVAVFIQEVQSTNPLRFVVELGKPVPLHAGAAGRAILSGLPAEEARAILGVGSLPSMTPQTVTDPDQLLALADQDRLRGYTVSIEERIPGGFSIAAPFFDRHGRCEGSMVFTGPLARVDDDEIPVIGGAVAASARALTQRLGRNGRG